MNPILSPAAPYSLPAINPVTSNNALTGWLFQPLQQNSSGTIPGTTVLNIGNVIAIDGNKDRIVIANPTTGINQIMMGLLPDGTYGLVISKPGIDVTTVFN